jgi:hypothetical protein
MCELRDSPRHSYAKCRFAISPNADRSAMAAQNFSPRHESSLAFGRERPLAAKSVLIFFSLLCRFFLDIDD